MNKAFVRELEDDVRHCPRCGTLGLPVTTGTLDHWLTPSARSELGDRALFCPSVTCEVAYFDRFERMAMTDDLQRPAWPKSPDAPLCSCFGLTADDIEADIEEGGVSRVRSVIERSRTQDARCQTLAPSGRSCVADVQRYYFKRSGHFENRDAGTDTPARGG